MSGEPTLRMTRQRRVIVEEMKRTRSHPTVHEVYTRVRRRLPRISLGTVYRNLEVLSACGLIRKLELTGRRKRFDATTEEHCHVRCLSCGRVDDVPGSTAEPVARRIAGKTGYEIVGHRLEFTGYCPRCRRRRRRGNDAAPGRKRT